MSTTTTNLVTRAGLDVSPFHAQVQRTEYNERLEAPPSAAVSPHTVCQGSPQHGEGRTAQGLSVPAADGEACEAHLSSIATTPESRRGNMGTKCLEVSSRSWGLAKPAMTLIIGPMFAGKTSELLRRHTIAV